MPWEDSVEEAHERKSSKYSKLAAEAEERGWKVKICPVQVGCRSFVGRSASRLLKNLEIRGQALRQATNGLSSVAEQSSRWLWMKRRDLSGLQSSRGSRAEWGTAGTPDVADEPSGGVVGQVIERLVKKGAHLMTPMKTMIKCTQPKAMKLTTQAPIASGSSGHSDHIT